ncbi:MAG: MerR family transcriptional regulator [Bosea sp. (in: a-proteobacteria)]
MTTNLAPSATLTGKTASATSQSDWATIGDIARDFDVTLRTLRFYESRGLLAPRREGMNRYYSAQDRSRLELILKGKKLGFTLTEIRALVAQGGENKNGLKLSLGQIDEQLKMLRSQLEECQSAIAELEDRRLSMVGVKTT